MRSTLVICALASVLSFGASCAPPAPPTRSERVTLRVNGDEQERVVGATISSGAMPIAVTGPDGTAELNVRGYEGESFEITVHCPTDYASPSAPIAIRALGVMASTAPAEYVARCPRTRHTMVVGVRATQGPHLPVLYLGREVARTDASGAADVLLEMKVNERVELTLATTDKEAAGLHPQNPSAVFEMRDRDTFAVFDVPFAREAPAVRRAVHRQIKSF